jgi:HlyD family secretion protein/macrolide-specific efflux system membrane fusion protein
LKKLILLLLVAGLAAGGFAFWQLRGEDKTIEVLESSEVTRGPVRKTLEATGIIKSQVGAIVKIGAQATGRIEQMLVKVGDEVAEGQLVAQIDDRELLAARSEARARLERAQAELDRVRFVFPLSIQEAESNVAAAKAEADYATTFFERQDRLYAQDLIAKDTLDDAGQQARVKAEALLARQATLRRTEAEFAKELKKSEKSVAEAQASLSTLETRLSYTRIFSPIDGVVSQVTAQEGETVVAGLQVANLITVLDPKRLEMWIYVDETDVGQVEPGLPVEFAVDAYPDMQFKGEINKIYPEPEIRDNIVYYRALVRLGSEKAEFLRPEMTTQCSIIVQVKDNVLSIPNTALKWVGGRMTIFRVRDDGSAEQVAYELGLQGIARSEVVSGLSEGDKVATRLTLPASISSGGSGFGGSGSGSGRGSGSGGGRGDGSGGGRRQ